MDIDLYSPYCQTKTAPLVKGRFFWYTYGMPEYFVFDPSGGTTTKPAYKAVSPDIVVTKPQESTFGRHMLAMLKYRYNKIMVLWDEGDNRVVKFFNQDQPGVVECSVTSEAFHDYYSRFDGSGIMQDRIESVDVAQIRVFNSVTI